MHDAFYNQMKSTIFLVMDLVPGNSLTQIYEENQPTSLTCTPLKVPEIREAFKQLLSAIDYLQDYEVGVCHRDINPNNVMLDLTEGDEGQRKVKLTLIDFNVAKRFLDPETGNPLLLMTNTGTARY